MKIFKRKTAGIQDYINYVGFILFMYVIVSRVALVEGNILVAENSLILICLGILSEMLFVNTVIFIIDFENWRYNAEVKSKYGKRKDDEKEE